MFFTEVFTMFETMQSFLAFFFPTLALIVLGILFEEKLIAFEQRIAQRLRRNGKQPTQDRPALHKVTPTAKAPRKGGRRAA